MAARRPAALALLAATGAGLRAVAQRRRAARASSAPVAGAPGARTGSAADTWAAPGPGAPPPPAAAVTRASPGQIAADQEAFGGAAPPRSDVPPDAARADGPASG